METVAEAGGDGADSTENAELTERERQTLQIEQELAVARKIQRTLLPRTFPQTGWFCAAGSSLASAQVAGDYFDVHDLGPDCWVAIVADVSGKGVGSALLAALLQGAFLLGSGLEVSPEILITTVNAFLVERAQREKYATLFYAVVKRAGVLTWVNAGHCPAILVRLNGETRDLHSTGMPLGLLKKATYGIEEIQLRPGDKVVAYSDGLTEAENAKGELFEPLLREAVKEAAALTAQEMHDRLVTDIYRFSGGAALQDDLTILVIEYRGAQEAAYTQE